MKKVKQIINILEKKSIEINIEKIQNVSKFVV